jgi:mannosyl-oligosaccharide alpha-1,2-mannosidase
MINWRDEVMDGRRFSIGAGMDSLYEYLPKMHMLLGGRDADYNEMTTRSLDAIRDHLLFRPMTPGVDEGTVDILLAGVAVMRKSNKLELVPDMQHLACFAGGMYGLAGRLLDREDYVDVARRFTNGCVWAYDAFPTGIMPEKAQMVACRDSNCAYRPIATGEDVPPGFVRIIDRRYLLRPEAIESVFYMWRITGDQAWRDAAWRMWEAIMKETETEIAFASIEDVTQKEGPMIDSMEVSLPMSIQQAWRLPFSFLFFFFPLQLFANQFDKQTFWMGETLKYFFLIFEDESVISLDEWILNTEAHPLRRPARE